MQAVSASIALKMTLQDSTDVAGFVETIANSTERAASLAHQLLSVAKQGAGDRTAVRTAALIEGVAQTMSVMLDSNMQIEWRVADGVPDIVANRSDIEQVLMNICLNARDAMPKGGRIAIEVAAAALPPEFCEGRENMRPGRHVCIAISDTGTGMEEKTVAQIFDPFFTTKEQGKGTGLGLATAYGAVVSHGGCIDVETEPGRGSLFRVYLPAAPDVETKGDAPTPDGLSRGSETVLLVDDENDMVAVGRRILENLGYTVLTASNGQEAVARYREAHNRVDLVLLDYMMPELDGEDAYLEMKRIDPDLKALVASGYQDDAKIQRILQSGADGFVHKPFRAAELSRLLRKVLDAP